jgi:hypothetical protein
MLLREPVFTSVTPVMRVPVITPVGVFGFYAGYGVAQGDSGLEVFFVVGDTSTRIR